MTDATDPVSTSAKKLPALVTGGHFELGPMGEAEPTCADCIRASCTCSTTRTAMIAAGCFRGAPNRRSSSESRVRDCRRRSRTEWTAGPRDGLARRATLFGVCRISLRPFIVCRVSQEETLRNSQAPFELRRLWGHSTQ